MQNYLTLGRSDMAVQIIQKSKFIGHACPAQSEEDALAFLAQIRQAHKTATHNCYAYLIGANQGIVRYSDDGEPGGTAGMPILEVLRAKKLTNCIVVVTRYFGGILLGAGGLVRAYSASAAAAVTQSGVVEMSPSDTLLIRVDYPVWDRVAYLLEHLPCKIQSTDYAADVSVHLLCKTANSQEICQKLIQKTDGRITPERIDQSYYPWPEEV